jgi:hypothetical protein
MGKNKHTLKLIAGQLWTLGKHQKKIEEELQKAVPNIESIKGWEREIDSARRRVRKLQERSEK